MNASKGHLHHASAEQESAKSAMHKAAKDGVGLGLPCKQEAGLQPRDSMPGTCSQWQLKADFHCLYLLPSSHRCRHLCNMQFQQTARLRGERERERERDTARDREVEEREEHSTRHGCQPVASTKTRSLPVLTSWPTNASVRLTQESTAAASTEESGNQNENRDCLQLCMRAGEEARI